MLLANKTTPRRSRSKCMPWAQLVATERQGNWFEVLISPHDLGEFPRWRLGLLLKLRAKQSHKEIQISWSLILSSSGHQVFVCPVVEGPTLPDAKTAPGHPTESCWSFVSTDFQKLTGAKQECTKLETIISSFWTSTGDIIYNISCNASHDWSCMLLGGALRLFAPLAPTPRVPCPENFIVKSWLNTQGVSEVMLTWPFYHISHVH